MERWKILIKNSIKWFTTTKNRTMKPNDVRELKMDGNDGDDESNRRRVEKV